MNDSDGMFFYVAHFALLDVVQLTLSKLCDRGKQNLTLESLVDEIHDPLLSKDLKERFAKIQDHCQEIKLRRDKQIAHFDSTTRLDGTSTLPADFREEIDGVLSEVRAFMNMIERRFDGTETAYNVLDPLTHGDRLIRCLREGLRYEELVRLERVPHDDFHNAPTG